MAKYSKEIADRILNLLSTDSYTIPEICAQTGIAETTYHRWAREKEQFRQSIKKAKEHFDEKLVVEAKRSLLKLVKGFEAEEKKTIYRPDRITGEPTIKEQTLTKKHYAPDTTAIIFTLKNKAPDEFKDRHQRDAKVDLEQKLGDLSEDQLNLIIDQVIHGTDKQ